MKNLITLLNSLKWNFLRVWIFFFVFSMFGWSRHTMLELLLIIGVWSAGIIAVSVILIKIKNRLEK